MVMMKPKTATLYALLLVAVLSLLHTIPATGAGNKTENVFLPVDFAVEDPCTGETIQLSGTQHLTIHTKTDNDGITRTTINFNFQGVSGIGLTSGQLYQAHSNATSIEIQPTDVLQTFVTNFSLVEKGAGISFLMHQTVQIRIDENGEEELIAQNIFSECK